MSSRLPLILLYGGKSGEHEVSLRSAACVLAALDKNKYDITPIAMDKEGAYLYQHCVEDLQDCGPSLPVVTPKAKRLPGFWVDGRSIFADKVVFPMVHGPLYEDGCLQGLLALAGVAFVGSPVMGSAIAMDKMLARQLASLKGIQSAAYESLSTYATDAEKDALCERVIAAWGWPLFVKPNTLGSSVGVQKVTTLTALKAAITDALRFDETILIEAGIEGREIEMAVLENATLGGVPWVSMPGELTVHHPDGFYSYTAKYIESDSTTITIPAVLPLAVVEALQTMAATLFTTFKCRGMARVDGFLSHDLKTIYFNELNTLPGFTNISMYPKLCEASGLSYTALLDRLIALALQHHRCQQGLLTNYM